MNTDVGGPGKALLGFALVEVLVCALLLGLGAAGIQGGLRASWNAARGAAAAGDAVGQLADLAEGLRAAPVERRRAVASEWQAAMPAELRSRVSLADAGAGLPVWEVELGWVERHSPVPVRVRQRIVVAP